MTSKQHESWDTMHFTSPRLWLAIPKHGSESFEFTLNDIYKADERDASIYNAHSEEGLGWYDLCDCRIFQYTGECDNKAHKIFAGHVVQRPELDTDPGYSHIGVPYWSSFGNQWSIRGCDNVGEIFSAGFWGKKCMNNLTIIGHIHRQDSLSTEQKDIVKRIMAAK